MDHVEVTSETRGQLLAPRQFFQRTKHEGQGSPKLVADIAEECCLRAIQLQQRLRSSPFFLVRRRVRNRGRDVTSGQVKKTAVVLVPGAARIKPYDEKRPGVSGPAFKERDDSGAS